MKRHISLLLCLFLMCSSAQAFYAPARESTVLDGDVATIEDQEAISIICSYFDAVNNNDYSTVISLSPSRLRPILTMIYSNETNRTNHIGFFNIEAIDVERIVPNMETILTRYFDEEILSNYEQVDVFLLKANVSVIEEDDSIKNGTSYFCVPAVKESGEIYVYDVVKINDALGETLVSDFPVSPTGISTPISDNILYYPQSIKVLRTTCYDEETVDRTGIIETVNFETYCQICLMGEFGTNSNRVEARKAVALAIRNYAFHRYLYAQSISNGFHLIDAAQDPTGTYFGAQKYDPGLTPTTLVKNAVADISEYFILDSDNRLIQSLHKRGSNDEDGKNGGVLKQLGANHLADQNYTFDKIIKYYYDRVAGVKYENKEVSVGPVTAHRHDNVVVSQSYTTHTLRCNSCNQTHTGQHYYEAGKLRCKYCNCTFH